MNMQKFQIDYISRNMVAYSVTVLAYSIKTAAAEFNTFKGFFKIEKITPA